MTNPIAVLLFQSLDNYNRIAAASPEKHTLPKALIYTIGTSIIAGVLYKTLTKNSRAHTHSFLSTFLKPFHTIFGNTTATATATATPHDTTTQLPFEEKYFKEYDEWIAQKEREREHNNRLSIAEEDHRKECLENMYYSTVRETINDFYGDIIMCYDHATFSFAYYARTGNIPYKYLETISRKYMIETNAPRDIHVDIRSEYQKAKERNNPTATATTTATATDTTDSAPQSVEGGQDDVFAKLKSYNTAYNLHAKTTTTTNDRNVKITQTPSSTETQQSSSAILRENANRYSYRGKITDFDEHHKTFLAERRNANTVNTATASASASASNVVPVAGGRNPLPVAGGRNPLPVAGGRNPQSYAEFKKRISAL